MKKLIFVLAFLFVAQTAFADVWVIYKTGTKEVYSVSNEDDCVMPASGYTKEILKKNLEDIQLQYQPVYYKYSEGKFIPNTEKIKADIEAEIEAQDKAKEDALIQDKLNQMARDALIKEGKIKEAK